MSKVDGPTKGELSRAKQDMRNILKSSISSGRTRKRPANMLGPINTDRRNENMSYNSRGTYEMDTGEMLVALVIAEVILAIVGVIATIIGYGAEMIVLTVFGASCLTCFVVAAVIVGFLALVSWHRSTADKTEDSKNDPG